ncbi:MAG: radical SAM protein, partial [Chloroflexi bacterium]|nr:radical SAM protein [Chloroflexota bacterium]
MAPVDILLVNPPSPDGGIWIRSQHRVGRRSREGMIWPQVCLAQMAALLDGDFRVEVVDAIAQRMSWPSFQKLLRERRPRYYLTQVTAPTLTNDLYGTFLAKALGARTVAFGTHVTPMACETMAAFPSLDFILRGEPEVTLLELLSTLSGKPLARWEALLRRSDPEWLGPADNAPEPLGRIKGLVWRQGGQVTVNPDRPLMEDLDDLPLPRHDLLPWDRYRVPLFDGPYTFVVTSRGCPANCLFCIKHVSYGRTVRVRSVENVLAELRMLRGLGLRNVHMYSDLFTA